MELLRAPHIATTNAAFALYRKGPQLPSPPEYNPPETLPLYVLTKLSNSDLLPVSPNFAKLYAAISSLLL